MVACLLAMLCVGGVGHLPWGLINVKILIRTFAKKYLNVMEYSVTTESHQTMKNNCNRWLNDEIWITYCGVCSCKQWQTISLMCTLCSISQSILTYVHRVFTGRLSQWLNLTDLYQVLHGEAISVTQFHWCVTCSTGRLSLIFDLTDV